MQYHFRYSLSIDDFAEYNAYTVWFAPWQKKYRLLYMARLTLYTVVAYTAIMIILHKLNPPQKEDFSFLLILSSIILFIVVFASYYQTPFFLKNKARKFIMREENKHILNEIELEINENGFINNDKKSKTQQLWSSIIRYAETKDYFFLYTNSIQAQIIPKKLFTSQREIEEFDKFLTEKIPLSSSFRSLGI